MTSISSFLRLFAWVTILGAIFIGVIAMAGGPFGIAFGLSFAAGGVVSALLFLALASIVDDLRRIATAVERGPAALAPQPSPRRADAAPTPPRAVREVGPTKPCSSCSAQNPATARFCYRCGKPVTAEAEVA